MDMLKPFGWHGEVGNGRHCVLVDFGTLAGEAFSSPLADVLFQVWPDEFISYGLPRPFNSRVAQTMYNVENPSTIG